MRRWWLFCSPLVVLGAWSAAIPVDGGMPTPEKVEAAGLHNVYRITARLYSGSSPEGDAGFTSLVKLGIKTILSVDGARPDVERAKKYGLRYVHLPIGYDSVSQSQALKIARAVRDLRGPVYLHCHHGKHRGPAAAAAAVLCLDGNCSVEAAVAIMKTAGTDAHYAGLYASPGKLRRPTKEELDRVAGDFPEVARVAALATIMVAIDESWEHLKTLKKAGWKIPKDAPDLDPPHEALQLREHYREAARLTDLGKKYPDELRRWLADAEAAAMELEQVLRLGKKGGVASAAADKHFQRLSASCAACHAKYRDTRPGW
jgi:protein tyrosine phosphatase (PTP) superfamily phosphohydrolase (DUF442 family)